MRAEWLRRSIRNPMNQVYPKRTPRRDQLDDHVRRPKKQPPGASPRERLEQTLRVVHRTRRSLERVLASTKLH
jgi:hypothetical protein